MEVTGPASQFGYLDEAFAFTGRWFDTNTNLQNNLNRWYDPGNGRWLSEDPIGFNAGDANLYRYVGNTVTNSTDPSGLWPAFGPPGYPLPPWPFGPPRSAPIDTGNGAEGTGDNRRAVLPPEVVPIVVEIGGAFWE